MLEEVMSMKIGNINFQTGASISTMTARGFTLIEMVVTIAVLGILLAIAVPSFNLFFEKFRTKRAAETLSGMLYQAKTEAVKRNQTVSLVITTSNSGATWCYGLVQGTNCDCTTSGTGACKLDGVEIKVTSADYRGVSLTSPASGTAYSFDKVRGTVGANTTTFVSTNGYQVNTVVHALGRIKTCTPSGTGNIGGHYTTC